MKNMNLTHHDDGKQRWQSHEVGLFEKDFYNQDYDIFSHNFMDLIGYGETKEQAVEDFKRKFRYLLDEWNAFAKLLLDSDVVENEMIEVDCFGEPIDKKGENEMSLNVRYLSNGKRALYCVSNTGVTPSSYTTYESINDIPESIRHYAPKGEPKVVDPDTAQLLGFGPDLFPEFEHRCMYYSDLAVACIGPGCQVVGEGSPIYCPYWVKEKNYENHG